MTAARLGGPLFEREILSDSPVAHLWDLAVDLQPAQLIPTPLGKRMTFVARGGRFAGPAGCGELLPGGGDWALLGADGVNRLDVRATLRTDDGVLIHYRALGVVVLPDDARERMRAGERLPYDRTYVRTAPRFETADTRYAWLNGIVAIAYGDLSPDHIDLRMYHLL